MTRVVSCPGCRQPVPWRADHPWRPFCSERCKTADIGRWATEEYRVPETEAEIWRRRMEQQGDD